MTVELNSEERAMLRWGLLDWGGPANPTDNIVRAMGFESVVGLHREKRRIADMISTGQPLTVRDWTRALIATEIVWASAVYGSGSDSQYTFGRPDVKAIDLLRSLQDKLMTSRAVSLAALEAGE